MASYAPIDADGHITETVEQLMPYFEDPRLRLHGTDASTVAATPRLYPTDGWDRSLGGRLGTRASTCAEWSRVADENGLDRIYLYPTDGLGIGCVREPEFAVALCRAYNTFLSEEIMKVDP